MLTFHEFCDFATCGERYSFIVIEAKFLDSFTEEEKSLVHIEHTNDNYVRLWYPKSKWQPRKTEPDDLMKAILDAAKRGDASAVQEIQKKMLQNLQTPVW